MPSASLEKGALRKCGIDFLPQTPLYARWWKDDARLWSKIKSSEDTSTPFPAELWVLKEALWKALPAELQDAFPTASSFCIRQNETGFYANVGPHVFLLHLEQVKNGVVAVCWPSSMAKPDWGIWEDLPAEITIKKETHGRSWNNGAGESGWLSVSHEGDEAYWAAWGIDG
jgi:hypothetical protein